MLQADPVLERLVKFWTRFVHCSDERRHVFHRRELGDTMAQVEDMARTAAKGVKHLGSFAPDNVRRG